MTEQDLIAHLLEKYGERLVELNPEKDKHNKRMMERLASFVNWSRDYLKENRPIALYQQWEGGGQIQNHGIQLTDGTRLTLAPAASEAMDMGAFSNVDTTGSLRVTGNRPDTDNDRNVGVDYSKGGKAVDKSMGAPAQRLDVPGLARDILNS